MDRDCAAGTDERLLRARSAFPFIVRFDPPDGLPPTDMRDVGILPTFILGQPLVSGRTVLARAMQRT
jgi:hypothetical protein